MYTLEGVHRKVISLLPNPILRSVAFILDIYTKMPIYERSVLSIYKHTFFDLRKPQMGSYFSTTCILKNNHISWMSFHISTFRLASFSLKTI